VEGSAATETEEEHTNNVGIRGAGNVGSPATWNNFSPPLGKKRKTTLDDGENPD
jgi:hypothetical protein